MFSAFMIIFMVLANFPPLLPPPPQLYFIMSLIQFCLLSLVLYNPCDCHFLHPAAGHGFDKLPMFTCLPGDGYHANV